MRILLAPMEGLLDWTLRDTLTRVGGIDLCVSEFIRVSGTVLPGRAFRRIVPELEHASRTPAGVPVRAQLLGSDPACMADNAARLAGLGPAGIDINFGCPAKCVNRHRGGAVLLNEPELIHAIVRAVRRAVPDDMPVTAKMRLGYDDPNQALDCALAMAEGGAAELVVHARTKADGYRPPAYWERIAPLKAALSIPVVANGEIWSVADYQRCRAESTCDDVMLGRGLIANPALALQLRNARTTALGWSELQPLLRHFWGLVETQVEPRHRAGRLKQWLNYLRRQLPEAEALYARIRTINDPVGIADAVFSDGRAPRAAA